MENDDNLASLKWLGNLCVRGKSTCSNGRKWAISEHSLDGMRRGSAAKTEKANRCYLVGTKARMLCFEINNELAHIGGKTARFLLLLLLGSLPKQACHAMFFKLFGIAAH